MKLTKYNSNFLSGTSGSTINANQHNWSTITEFEITSNMSEISINGINPYKIISIEIINYSLYSTSAIASRTISFDMGKYNSNEPSRWMGRYTNYAQNYGWNNDSGARIRVGHNIYAEPTKSKCHNLQLTVYRDMYNSSINNNKTWYEAKSKSYDATMVYSMGKLHTTALKEREVDSISIYSGGYPFSSGKVVVKGVKA